MTAAPGIGNGHGKAAQSVTLTELDASIGSGPEVPDDEIAVRYYSDEALWAVIRPRSKTAARPVRAPSGQ